MTRLSPEDSCPDHWRAGEIVVRSGSVVVVAAAVLIVAGLGVRRISAAPCGSFDAR